MKITAFYKLLLKTSGFSSQEIMDPEWVRRNSEPRDVVCVLLDAFGFSVSDIASLLGIHRNAVYQSLYRERECRFLSRWVYFALLKVQEKIEAEDTEQGYIREALCQLGLTEDQVRFGHQQGKKNLQIREICLLYLQVKDKVCLKVFEDFTGTSHTSIHKYLKTHTLR